MLAATFALLIDNTGGTISVPLLLATILLAASACMRVLPLVGGREAFLSPVHGFLGGFVALLVLLTFTSTLAENSVLFGWRLAMFALVAFVALGFSRSQYQFALGLFLLAGALSGLWGIGEYLATGLRANGPVIDPSTWGAMQNLFFFAALAVFLGTRFERAWQPAVLVLGLAIFATAAFAAYSRVGNFIFWAALIFIIAVCARHRDLRRRLAVVAIVSVVAFSAVNLYSPQSEAAQHDEGYTLDVQSYGWSQRILMWESALDIYLESPVFGTGPGTFKLHYPRFRSPEEQRNSGNFVHNDYLQFLSEGGPLLLFFLLAFAGWLTWRLFLRATQTVLGDRDAIEPMLLAVAMGTPLTHAIMNFPLYQVQILMLMGLLFARFAHLEAPGHQVRLAPRSPRLSRALVVVIATLAVMPVALDLVTQDLVLDDDRVPVVHHLGDDSESYLSTMRVLTMLRSRNALNHFGMATIYRTTFDQLAGAPERESLAVASAIEYERGLAINPWHGQARGYYAGFLEENPWLTEVPGIEWTPEALYRDGVARTPSSVEPYLRLAEFLRRQGRDDEAYRLLVDEAMPWANHRSANWERFRLELAREVLRGATARGDTRALARLRELLDG